MFLLVSYERSQQERLASLQRSLDFQKEELDSISDYNEKLEQLVRQKDALLTDSSRDVPMERMHNVHSLLLYHKNNLQLWRQDIEALRNCFTTSLQNVHKYLFHQLYALVESFNGQHVQCLRQSQENRRLRRYIQEWKGNIRVVARVSVAGLGSCINIDACGYIRFVHRTRRKNIILVFVI